MFVEGGAGNIRAPDVPDADAEVDEQRAARDLEAALRAPANPRHRRDRLYVVHVLYPLMVLCVPNLTTIIQEQVLTFRMSDEDLLLERRKADNFLICFLCAGTFTTFVIANWVQREGNIFVTQVFQTDENGQKIFSITKRAFRV